MTPTRWLPPVITPEDLALLREGEQSSEIFLGILNPAIIYSARVNQLVTTKDKVTQITYSDGVGTLAEILEGMTLRIGTAPGLSDLGEVRIRKLPTSEIFYVGENSDVLWIDEAHLTVVDDFNLWARHLAIVDNIPYMDDDIAYTNQHNFTSPVPILGPRLIPTWLIDGSAEVIFDASLSWTFEDTTIASYDWSAPGSLSSTGMDSAEPHIFYDTPGTYRVSCLITAANGKTTRAHSHVMIFSEEAPPITQFNLLNCSGSASEGGWKFSVQLWAEASLGLVKDKAQVVLFARDFYGTTQQSLGPIPHRENIIATGWIVGQSIQEDPNGGTVGFAIEGTQAWMKRLPGFPIGIQNTGSIAENWTSWMGLTVDKSLYHLFYWQSTIIPVVDVFLTQDTRISPEQYAPGETTLADQLTQLLQNTLMGTNGSDRFGRLFCEIDTQLTPPLSRDYNEQMSLEKIDWRDALPITRNTVNSTSQVNLSGITLNPPGEPQAIFSLAPGHVYTPQGKPSRRDRLLLATQAQSNELAAMRLAWDNFSFQLTPEMSSNNRFVDVFPSHAYIRVVVNEEDTPRGFQLDGNFIVREISLSFESTDDGSNYLQHSWTLEEEVFPGNSTDGDTPESPVPSSGFTPFPPFPSTPEVPYIIPGPVDPETIQNVVVLVQGVGLFYTNNFSSLSTPNWYAMNSGIPDPTLITNFEISSSGRCFCKVGLESVWSSPAPGQPWEMVFNSLMIGNPGEFPFPRDPQIIAFGINRDADDELTIIAGVNVTIFGSFTTFTWRGSSSGVIIASTDYWAITDPGMRGTCTYANGQWVVVTSASGGTITSFTLDDSGATLLYTVPTATSPSGSPYIMSTRGNYAADTIMIANNFPISISQDNGENYADLGIYAPPPYPNSEALGSDPSGQFLLVGTQFEGMKRSSDGGTTWGLTPVLGAVTCVRSIGTPENWLFSFIGQILYSPDFGNTFYYKTGDLASWAGALFSISAIRYY